jgi:crotonobetainyl-CoA:carnitine CoA-transferase CaiB-like acyl-CoA transferase
VHYRCRDDHWLLLSVAPDEWRWEKFKECLGASALSDPRFATHQGREANAYELIAILDEVFATKDFAEWQRVLEAAGIIFGIVAKMEDIPSDPQILASEALVPFTDRETMTVNSPFWINGQDKVKPRRAPNVGEHSAEVLRDAGYSDAEIRALRAEGVIA